jgi:hypothetical protein
MGNGQSGESMIASFGCCDKNGCCIGGRASGRTGEEEVSHCTPQGLGVFSLALLDSVYLDVRGTVKRLCCAVLAPSIRCGNLVKNQI